jgi:hypothetical protein
MWECILDPSDLIPFDGDDVISYRRAKRNPVIGPINRRDAADLLLFPKSHRFPRRSHGVVLSKFHFTKDQVLSVLSHKVDLALAAAIILCQNPCAMLRKITGSRLFLIRAESSLVQLFFFRIGILPSHSLNQIRIKRNYG